jgi:homoserine/homoserine lactone efflux protein
MNLTIWLTFVTACILFSLSPGAGAITSINNSLTGGIKVALKGIVGLQCALAIHLMIVFLGLGALLASSVVFFEIIKYAGAAYLLYLGIQKFRQHSILTASNQYKQNGCGQLIKQGLIVNLINPKTIVFLTAFLPHFLSTNAPMAKQYLILGSTVVLIDTMVMLSYAFLASMIRPYLVNERIMSLLNKVFGSLFISMGLALATSKR